MPYNKGDFTQQGVAGDVTALVRLNEKRTVKLTLSADDASDNCDISGTVYDDLNGTTYSIVEAASGKITITENGTDINVAQYRTADVDVTAKSLWDEDTQVFSNQSRFNVSKDSDNVWTFTLTGSDGYAYATSDITLDAGTYIFGATVHDGDFLLQRENVRETITNPFTLTETSRVVVRVYRSGVVGDVVTLSHVTLFKIH